MTLPDDVKKLVDGPNFAHLATLMPDGSPQIAPVWVGREGEEVQIRGRIVERRPDGDLSVMDAISHKYTSAPFPRRDPAGRVALVLEADRVRHLTLPFRHAPGGP